MRSTIGIDVDAPPDLVFAIVGDVTRWQQLLPHYSRSRVERRHADGSATCSFVARRSLVPLLGVAIPVAWRSRVDSDAAARRLHFEHVGGVTAGMDVTWTLGLKAGAGTRVEIEHVFERGPADILPGFVDRFFVRAIAARTLATFKSLSEALAAAGLGP
jgi:ribosome-associated toxin RatA of RatAB toxin-antitoxin module